MLVLVVLLEEIIAVRHLLAARTRALLLGEAIDGRRKQAYCIFEGAKRQAIGVMFFRTRQEKGDKGRLIAVGT